MKKTKPAQSWTVSLGLATVLAVGLLANESRAEKKRPIIDTHIHFYQVTAPGGIPWPSPKQKLIYRDVTPAEYKEVAKANGITGAVIVEANPTVKENYRVLDVIKGDSLFKGMVGNIEIGTPDFVENLDKLAKDKRIVGIRGFLWAPTLSLDEKQLTDLKALQARGMTLDIISRNTLNPKDKVDALAKAVPNLRIIIDHLAGAKGAKVDPAWAEAIHKLAENKNIYIKFSSFFDMFNPAASEDEPWKAPTDLASYKPHFDVLMKEFGADRLIFGSNWPVVALGGDIGSEIAIAEEYLKGYGNDVRDKVMYKNAEKFYKRMPPKGGKK
jgi:predicted TIM-barrel fold metal-dependent hydrolase